MPTPETFQKWQHICRLSDAIQRIANKPTRTSGEALQLQRLLDQRRALQATLKPVLVVA